MTEPHDWSADVFAALKARDVTVVATVPDGGLTRLLALCGADPGIEVVTLTSEEEGIGLLCGLWLGGRRGVLVMQSSGSGNCVNALSLPAATGAPCAMLITMRGVWDEQNPWQVPMGQAARTVFEAMGVVCTSVTQAEAVGPAFAEAADRAFDGGRATAVLVDQRVIGTKRFE